MGKPAWAAAIFCRKTKGGSYYFGVDITLLCQFASE